MSSKEEGIIDKYTVRRNDGRLIEDGCMVMEWGDEHAHKGIAAFSESVRNGGYIKLADELDKELGNEAGLIMATHDSQSTADHMRTERDINGLAYPWDPTLETLSRVQVTGKMSIRPHKFDCGTDGEVVDEITIKLKLPKGKIDMQPHNSILENCMDQFLKTFSECEIEGWIEN